MEARGEKLEGTGVRNSKYYGKWEVMINFCDNVSCWSLRKSFQLSKMSRYWAVHGGKQPVDDKKILKSDRVHTLFKTFLARKLGGRLLTKGQREIIRERMPGYQSSNDWGSSTEINPCGGPGKEGREARRHMNGDKIPSLIKLWVKLL